MMGHGKDCRYELHHPMSLGDALAALFRGKPKKSPRGKAEILDALGRQESDEPGTADDLLHKEIRERAGAGDLMVK